MRKYKSRVTHEGVLEPNDPVFKPRAKIYLRETADLWISYGGKEFLKENGEPLKPDEIPDYSLDIKSVSKLDLITMKKLED